MENTSGKTISMPLSCARGLHYYRKMSGGMLECMYCRQIAVSLVEPSEKTTLTIHAIEKKQEKKKIYISGRITGLDIEVAEAKFKEAADYVNQAMEYEPVNPFDINVQAENKTWKDYMITDIKALVDCDAILMLDNWKDSKGAKTEYYIARQLDLKIYYI